MSDYDPDGDVATPAPRDPTAAQPFTIQVEHDGVDTTTYELTENTILVASEPASPTGVNFQYPAGLPPGSYTFVVTAVGPGGRTASAPLELILVPPATGAAPPTQPRIVIVIG